MAPDAEKPSSSSASPLYEKDRHAGDDDCERDALNAHERAQRERRSDRDARHDRDDSYLKCKLKGPRACEAERTCRDGADRKLRDLCGSWRDIESATAHELARCKAACSKELIDCNGPADAAAERARRANKSASQMVNLGRPVPLGFVQFNPRPGDVGDRPRLAQTGGVAGIRYRVRAFNGNGIRGEWSDWKISDKASCTALGFKCGP